MGDNLKVIRLKRMLTVFNIMGTTVIECSITLTNLLLDQSFFAKVVKSLGAPWGYLRAVQAPSSHCSIPWLAMV
jgi:hypothetical protein